MPFVSIIVAIGFALILLRSMIDRGFAARFNDEIAYDSNDWSYELKPGGFGRLLRFVAGLPAFVILTYLAISSLGWWALLLLPGGFVLAFGFSMALGLMAGSVQSDRDHYASGIRKIGTFLPAAVILWVLVVVPIVLGGYERSVG